MPLSAGIGSETSHAIRSLDLDADQCYRIRELQFTRGDVQFSLTDGYIIFSKPIAGSPIAAVFSSAVDAGDGEILLLPPDRDERRILAARANGPNLEEHLADAAFFFADDTAIELLHQIQNSEWMHKDAQFGETMAQKYTPMLRNKVKEFETTLLLDLLTAPHQRQSFFAALVGGKTLGAFDVIFDPRSPEQILAGREQPDKFELWTSYTPKSLRGKTREPDFRADRYHLDSRIDSKLHMRVESTFVASGMTRDLNALSFDMSRQMKVISAEVDGQPAEIAEQTQILETDADPGDRLFLIIPATSLKAGTEHTVKVIHEGDVITAGPNHVYFVGSRGRWYPHRALEFARFDMRFRFPKHLDLVAPGDPVVDKVDGDERIIERHIDTPIPMLGFNLGSYTRTVVERGGFTVEMCANKDNPAADPNLRPAALANDIADVMQFFSRRFGPPPLKRLIVSPIPGTFGQGFGGLIYLSTMAYMRPSGKAFVEMDPQAKIFFTDLMHAHEVAHQWWGNLVLTAGYHDEWITEALANYSAMLYIQEHDGPKPVDTLLSAYRDSLLDVDQAGPVTQGRRLELEGKPNAWVTIMYGKGSWIMQMLRARMGDDQFWKMLAELRHRYERKSLTTEQFRALCAEFMPKGVPDPKLQAFFDQWVYGMGIPSLKLESSIKGAGAAGNLHVSGTLTQKDVPEDFSADFPVVIDLPGKKVIKWVTSSSDPVTFSVPVSVRPKHVELDPDNQFLKR